MSESPRYWTREFVDQFVARLNSDPDFQRIARNFSDTIILQCIDDPDGKDVRAAYIIDGGYVTVDLEIGDSPSSEIRDRPLDVDKEFARASAPYAIWRQLDSGELNVMGAMASPDYRIEGPTLKIMMNMGVFNALSHCAAALEKTY